MTWVPRPWSLVASPASADASVTAHLSLERGPPSAPCANLPLSLTGDEILLQVLSKDPHYASFVEGGTAVTGSHLNESKYLC